MRLMPRILAALAALFVLSTPLAAQEPSGTVLTVSGDIGNTNRGRFDQFHDGLLNYHGKSFEKAFEFDRAALAAMPQQSITANAEPWSEPLRMEGPKLADVLAAAGAAGKPITVYAIDGYGAAMTVDQIAAHEWVLALKTNGKPLGIGGRGPLWLAYDTGSGKATAEQEGAWVWSIFHIEVGE